MNYSGTQTNCANVNHPVAEPRIGRRNVLSLLLATSAIVTIPLPGFTQTRDTPLSIPLTNPAPGIGLSPFTEPPVIASADGRLDTKLTVQMREEVIDGEKVRYRTYDGLFTGPTLRFQPGDNVRVLLDNQLPSEPEPEHPHDPQAPHGFNTTNLHTHGLWVSPAGNADNVLLALPPGREFQHEYFIPDTHKSGTFWYHPHKHGSVELQVKNGMSGALIIEGGIDDLPEIKAAQERLMVIQQIQPEARPEETRILTTVRDIAGAPNKVTTINGVHAPTLQMRAGAVERWRLIAANYHDLLHIELRKVDTKAKLPMFPIAYDGLPVRDVIESTRIRLAPGNRIDILVQPPSPGSYEIYKIGDQGQFDTEAEDAVIGFFEVMGPITAGSPIPKTLPAKFSHKDISAEEVSVHRDVLFSILEGDKTVRFVINGKEFEDGRVDHRMKLGTVEEWRLENNSDAMHPFHIHVNPFQIVESSDSLIKPGTWHDTIAVPPRYQTMPGSDEWTPGHVIIRTRVERYIGQFVQHCHILAHEDRGMMQLIEISQN